MSPLEIVFLPSAPNSPRGPVFPAPCTHLHTHMRVCTHTCCPNGPPPHPAPSLPPTGPADSGTVPVALQAPAWLRGDAHAGDGAVAPRTDPRAGPGWGWGLPDSRMAGQLDGRTDSPGWAGDARQPEAETAARRMKAPGPGILSRMEGRWRWWRLGRRGGGGPSAPSHGDPRDPGLPPAQERGRRRRTGGGRGCLLAQVPPSPSLKGQTDEGMERRTEERSWGARVAGVGGRG